MKVSAVFWDVLKVTILLSILVSNCFFYYRVYTGLQRPATTPGAIDDALLMVGQKRLQLQDSLIKLDQDYEALTFKKDSVDRLGSTQRAALRASYRAKLRAAAGSSLRTDAPGQPH